MSEPWMLNNIWNQFEFLLDLKIQAQSFLFVLGNSEKDNSGLTEIGFQLNYERYIFWFGCIVSAFFFFFF